MRLPFSAMRAAIYTRLSQDLAGTSVYSHTPRETALPYIAINDAAIVPQPLKQHGVHEVSYTLNVWSNQEGFAEVEDLLQRAAFSLTRMDIALTGWQVAGVPELDTATVSEELIDDGLLYQHGTLTAKWTVFDQETL